MIVCEEKDKQVCLVRTHMRKGVYHVTKRVLDVALALVASVVTAIPVAVLAVVITCMDFGNPFYIQRRVGKDGEIFRLVKLRSMKKGADKIEKILSAEQLAQYQKEYKLDDDPRLIGWKKPGDGTHCFGAWLRRSSLDEIPQIFVNVLLTGKMSVVGPRPILPDELQRHYTPKEQECLLSVKPGLTGYWQANARNNATYETGKRQQMELFYAENANFLWDLKILWQTAGAVIRKQGAK